MRLTCFVMMQFQGEHQDVLFEKIEVAVNRFNQVTEHSIEVVRADLTPPISIQSLEEHLEAHIQNCDIAIADISQLNPNVLFEMGYAIGVDKPVIIMARKGEKIPADFSGRLYLEWKADELQLLPQKLQGYIRGAIESILARRFQRKYTVPVYADRGLVALQEKFSKATSNVDVLTTNLFSLAEAGHVDMIQQRLSSATTLKVRILTLDPESDFAAHRARQVGISTRHFRDQLRDSLENTSRALKEYPEACRIATYNEFPTQIAFRIDDAIYFQVVSANRQSRNNPLLIFPASAAGVSESILSHFDTVWGRAATVQRR